MNYEEKSKLLDELIDHAKEQGYGDGYPYALGVVSSFISDDGFEMIKRIIGKKSVSV